MNQVERDKLLEELEEKHGEIDTVETALGLAVFRCPTRGEYKRFQTMASDARKRVDAVETLVRTCIVHPSPEVFDSWCDKKPATPSGCIDVVIRLAGITEEMESGKA